MATAATDTWSQTRDQIISDALANVGAIAPGETAAGAMLDHAVRAINRVVKSIDADGQFLWRLSRLTFTTTSGTANYTLNAFAFAVDEPMRFTRSGQSTGTPLSPMTVDEYMLLSDRTTSGQPSRYVVERSLSGNGVTLLTVRLWPVPDATGDTVEYQGALRAKDLTSGNDSLDFPTSWITCILYGLMAELAPGYGQAASADGYRERHEFEKARLLNADNEQQDLWLVPRMF